MKYQQQEQHTCIFSSAASALHHYDMTEYAKFIHNLTTTSLVESNIFQFFLQDVLRKHKTRHFDAINAKKRGFTWETLDVKYVYIAQLKNQTGDCTHTIAIYNGWIFDSNLSYAIKLNKENLDWCSASDNSLCQYSECTGFLTLHCLTPVVKRENKRKERYEK
jgi:hypothetical protein